jgi:ammonia channel protein AmtB
MGALRAATAAAPINLAVAFLVATPAFAETSTISAADTAWMIAATALVLMMTVPGLALFYSGLVRKKNVLATMAQSLAAVAVLLVGVFATASIGGTSGLIEGNPGLLLIQLYGVAVTLVWSGGVTYVLLKLVSAFVPLRVSREHELEGLDISQHGEALQ